VHIRLSRIRSRDGVAWAHWTRVPVLRPQPRARCRSASHPRGSVDSGSLAGMRHVRLPVARGSDSAQTRDRVCEGGWDVRDNGWSGVEWSGETGLPCVHVVCKERWACFGGWCTCGENGWLGRRKRGCHASDSLTDLGLDGCWALSLVFAVAASFGCLVDTCSLLVAYTGIWYIAVMMLCGFCVFIFSPVVLRSFFSLRSCGSCIAVCLSDSLSAEA
jgi:hypothetical protein